MGDGTPKTPRLQVLVLGLPRCATTSTAAALESPSLGITPVLHAADSGRIKQRSQLILAALRLSGPENTARRRSLLHQVVDGYAACTETLNALADDLMDMYPSAKIVLNVRPPPKKGESVGASWARSCDAITFCTSPWGLLLCWLVPAYRFWWMRYRLQADLWRLKGLLEPAGVSRFFTPKGRAWMVPEFYDRYIEWVQDEADRRGREVLVWHPGMGWAPLCEFLGREAPPEGTPLPRLNDSAASHVGNRDYVRRGLAYYAVVAVVIGVVAWWLRSASGSAALGALL